MRKSDLQDTIRNFIKEKYKPGDTVFPQAISRLGCSTKDAYRYIEPLKSEDLVAPRYLVVCPKCNRITSYKDSLSDVPADEYCDNCDLDFRIKTGNLRVVYRKL